MNYIVFDLEWNQCPYGKNRENEKLPFEIIEIGAVKLDEHLQKTENFHCLIQPVVYKKLHYRTQDIIGLTMKELEKGVPFYRAIREFISWCGEDFMFATWGNMDLLELQRNMKYYGVLKLLPGPIQYLDVQKLFGLTFEDVHLHRSLEYAVDFLHFEKDVEFHRALADAVYTAKVLEKIDPHIREVYFSVDTYQNPKCREEEMHLSFETYHKYISREFPSKEEAMHDREVTSTRCIFCNRNARKRLRWFSINARQYYCIASCPEHGLIKGKIRMKKTEDNTYYVVKTVKAIDEEQAAQIREKKATQQVRRKTHIQNKKNKTD